MEAILAKYIIGSSAADFAIFGVILFFLNRNYSEKINELHKKQNETEAELKRQSERTHSLTTNVAAIQVDISYIKKIFDSFDKKLDGLRQ